MKGDNFDWTRGRGATLSVNTGPSNDHTLGNSLGQSPGSRYIILHKEQLSVAI